MYARPDEDLSGIDLRGLLRKVGFLRGQRTLLSTPTERTEVEIPVEMLDDERKLVTADPLKVAGYVDGIQNATLLTFREYRPVFLNYIAAGAISGPKTLIGYKERLEILCADEDEAWVRALKPGAKGPKETKGEDGAEDKTVKEIPVKTLGALPPPDMERAAVQRLGAVRERLERTLVEELSAAMDGYLVLDGSLVARPHNSKLVGVIKSLDKKYLVDESILWGQNGGLKVGWMSPRFRIVAGMDAAYARYSCYLRLSDATNQSWSFGLIRLETYDPDLLEPLAAVALGLRQGRAQGDRRFDKHLVMMRYCEEMMRARRPNIYGILG